MAALLVACDPRGVRDEPLVRASQQLRGEVERYADWVERTLRTHEGDGARAEVLFSPLRLDSRVLAAVVSVGASDQRYALHADGDAVPGEGGWTPLRKSGPRRPLAVRRASCRVGEAEGEPPVACVWIRLDRSAGDPVLGFRLWVAYRLD